MRDGKGEPERCPNGECRSKQWKGGGVLFQGVMPGGALMKELSYEKLEDGDVGVAAPKAKGPVPSKPVSNLEGMLSPTFDQATVKGIPTGGKGYGGRDLVKKPKLNVPITAPKKVDW